jgi:Zn-finger nucleic acid-binding protein
MALVCPRCTPTELEELEFGDITIDRCPRCAGLWFDNSEVAAITELKTEQFNIESIVPSSDFAETTMTCPRCEGVALRKLPLKAANREQIVYRCISCLGTWLDRGELRDQEDPALKAALTAYFSKFTGKDVH